ncbi:hypothetical protein [Lysobacter gummosus]|uniref:hypothetical protein n=1 Tax=Lysobacter gummosus TaxID=262324 RepID=UPI00363AD3F0
MHRQARSHCEPSSKGCRVDRRRERGGQPARGDPHQPAGRTAPTPPSRSSVGPRHRRRGQAASRRPGLLEAGRRSAPGAPPPTKFLFPHRW